MSAAKSDDAEMHSNLLAQTRQRMGKQFTSNQVLGRKLTIGCTAVEITQRCNLDCTLCYLSDNSESVQDIPLEEIFQRLDNVRKHFGAGAHVQITGGDPTLRKHTELIAIVRYANEIGLYPALFTNGIAASRKLLAQLAGVGLSDVAFHVDTTQGREGYKTETDLNAVRDEYIERARGLGLMVIFNTTVHEGNYSELPSLVKFFTSNADVVGFTSFQLQADTGRGEWGCRDVLISQETVCNQLESGVGRRLPWDIIRIGHPGCHRYLPALVVNNHVYPVIEDQQWFTDFLINFFEVQANRHSGVMRLLYHYGVALVRQPRWWPHVLRYVLALLWRIKKDLIKARGRVHKLSFFVQNFMDAKHLEQERIDACSFMVMTTEGPVSMCTHNAKRDDYILKPITVTRSDGSVIRFEPLVKQSKAKQQVTESLEEEAMM